MSWKIAILEDDPDIRKLLEITFQKEGYKTLSFENGKDFLSSLEDKTPDILILDLMLPDIDGLEICKQLRSNPETCDIPIIILSAKGEELDKVLGLELGADDYVTKPFSPRELVARVKANLRRKSSEGRREREILVGELKIIPEKYEVYLGGEKIELTTTEFQILLILANDAGKVFSREEIINRLWGGEKFILDRTIDVHIKKLRDKLKSAGKMIKSVRGVGYKLEK